jgi:ribosomal 50S subunit-associated protein YjgA (DUF615 family)
LLLVALTINAAAGVLHPAVIELGHDAASQRLAVRLWSQSVTRSVQRLIRKQDERPAIHSVETVRVAMQRLTLTARTPTSVLHAVEPLREAILALPPPVL